jgi:hypothetical protein
MNPAYFKDKDFEKGNYIKANSLDLMSFFFLWLVQTQCSKLSTKLIMEDTANCLFKLTMAKNLIYVHPFYDGQSYIKL